ncbi:hypothetical protein NPF39_001007 [Salmonella enterica subsp. enterica serovar Uganda]|uniref:hypothetical protein n=1 Tax=Enterobacter cloacae complex TaxID=354276 RepID=UPI000DBF3244|nr:MULTISPECIES: hypothetical protein [Enterobacter cloacae complex]EJN2431573.1 hypothetical protein [Salmonella enterica subsp. enterica serovar Uganda]EMD6793538.1 hypothetical protein [Enterobacter hormaechei subsp. steigerwaltii]HED3540456.1 hypothetical protein [Enterobacter hormaechei subsp. hormaechei]AWX04426.1 hypothetical protein DPF84_22905 [Enterobacter hormaechei]ELD3391300.1 hypothetical protein [Enterobacter hormaechei]
MSKLTRELVANAMLSSIENYLFEILDSVQADVGELSPEECYSLNAWVRSAVEKAAAEVETAQ